MRNKQALPSGYLRLFRQIFFGGEKLCCFSAFLIFDLGLEWEQVCRLYRGHSKDTFGKLAVRSANVLHFAAAFSLPSFAWSRFWCLAEGLWPFACTGLLLTFPRHQKGLRPGHNAQNCWISLVRSLRLPALTGRAGPVCDLAVLYTRLSFARPSHCNAVCLFQRRPRNSSIPWAGVLVVQDTGWNCNIFRIWISHFPR